ncbi:MAG TPA: hypothetical protein VG498_05685 [Terriglobales bacterium]|nr:hypothetical protein [Terriglobales bacterium]
MLNYKRVYGGSVAGDECGLCDNCIFSVVMKGQAESERLTICDWPCQSVRVPFRVVMCSCFTDKRLPSVSDMEDIALELTKEPTKTTGFVSSSVLANGTTEDSS